MEPIHSGTTAGRIGRTVLLVVLVCGYAVWSLVDGYVSWPRRNVESVLTTKLGLEIPDPLPVINPEITSERTSEIPEGERLDEAASRIGCEPFQHRTTAYCFGNGGFVQLETEGGLVKSREWVDGPNYPPTELRVQKIIGFGLLPVGLVCLIQLIRVLTTRVSLTEGGLKVRGRPLIPFEAMTGIRAGKDAGLPRGIAVLDYTIDDRASRVRLDNYVVKQQAAIVAVICEKKGFDKPAES
jgi:hypothetical protein